MKHKLYYVTRMSVSSIGENVGLLEHEAFIVADKKREAVEIAHDTWGGELEQYNAKKVKFKHKGFLSALMQEAEKSKV